MTYRLSDSAVEVETVLENLGAEPMPVSIGFHPYFRVHDAPRDVWSAHVAARTRVLLGDDLIPTGEICPVTLVDPHPLAVAPLDDVFTGLVRDPGGAARFWVKGERQTVSVSYGPKYTVAVVYAPAGRDFICFEPMAAVTNALNLAHRGKCDPPQTVPPNGIWKESFRIEPSGF
jgi:aldose 1-epimerase